MSQVIHQTRFAEDDDAWSTPLAGTPGLEITGEGALLSPADGESVELRGSGVHTRNGDHIELRFRILDPGNGWLRFGFEADRHEHARVEVDLGAGAVSFWSSDWRFEQPAAAVERPALSSGESHVLSIEKTASGGGLIRNARVAVCLDGDRIIALDDLDVLPEMGVLIEAGGARVLVEEFVHRGAPSGVPEYLCLGGYQVLNVDSIEQNLASICRGLHLAAECGVELLVTPEASLTGLYPTSPRTRDPGPVAAAEAGLQRFIRDLPNAPHTIVGLPVWETQAAHGLEQTRYIASRVYDPDGEILHTARKVHSAEQEVWHGHRLNEFDINGVPVSLHICHDRRYPELQTLPVMFGCRLLLHPSNGGDVTGSVSAFEALAADATGQTHAFYMNVNAGGGSYIAGPQTKGEFITASAESRRDNANFPMVGAPVESLFHADIRIHDAFGYWPTRSFRASESMARAYGNLYRELGGTREDQPC